jgi:phage baseplate assembly protein W
MSLSIDAKTNLSLSVTSDGYDVSIADSLKDIFTTRKGSVVMNPEFGSDLYLLIDRRIDDEWLIDFRRYIADAVAFEPRIELASVEITATNATDGSVAFKLYFVDGSIFEGVLNGF